MAEMDGSSKLDIATLVESLVVALKGQATARPHPILYINLAFVLTLAFAFGSLWTRVSQIEAKSQGVDSIQVVSTKVDTVQQELMRIRDRLDRMDDGGGKHR